MLAELALIERRLTKWVILSLPFLAAPKQSGRKFLLAGKAYKPEMSMPEGAVDE